MSWRYIGLTWILTLFLILRFYPEIEEAPRSTTNVQFQTDDPESILATGGRLPLACSDHFALELISGVSTNLTSELLKNRFTLRALAAKEGERSAFLSVKGVGDKKRDTLVRYISLVATCRRAHEYTIFIPAPHPHHPVR
jgi:hypothetical protein